MKFSVSKIDGNIPHVDKPINICLNTHNLVVTGQNGSGKTSFLKALFSSVKQIVHGDLGVHITRLKQNISDYRNQLAHLDNGDPNYLAIQEAIKTHEKELGKIDTQLDVEISNSSEFRELMSENKAVIRYFPAMRHSKVHPAQGAGNDQQKPQSFDLDANFGAYLEQYLVNLRTRRAFALTDDNNEIYAETISDWFDYFTTRLRYLFEDESTVFEFDSQTFKFEIHQNGKEPFTFQTLSAGYTALLDIFADLLLRSELNELLPSDLLGIVMIDEIDAHLHVSIQRKVLKFFTDVFPNIQFIVTTHSPFVLSSIDDAIIYDLTLGEEVGPDLSMYSYNTIVEGILGVSPASKILQEKVSQLMEELKKPETDISATTSYLKNLSPHVEQMDVESRSIYEEGRKALFLAKNNNKFAK